MYEVSSEYEVMYGNIINETIAYLEKNNQLKSLIVGISGGIDSALTVALANAVCKKTGTLLIGRSLPCVTNTPGENERAIAVGNAFCHDFKTVDIGQMLSAVESNMEATVFGTDGPGTYDAKVRQGNIKARLRMIQLFHLAHFHRGMVLSTDNFTELMLGFWTLHGDVGNFGMIQNLWKTEVYGLAKWIIDNYFDDTIGDGQKAEALQACINAVPTDGLGITASDFEQIFPEVHKEKNSAVAYGRIDEILIDYLNDSQYLDHPVVQKFLATQFKRDDPFNIDRKKILQS